MLFSAKTITALLATASQAFSSPTEVKRAGGTIKFVNDTPRDVNYVLVGPSGTVATGTVPPGDYAVGQGLPDSQILPLPPTGQGYSLKLSQADPQSSSGILQFQYTRNSDNNIVYNWSALNGSPGDPFVSYSRLITPTHRAGSCKSIECNRFEGDTGCEATTAGQGPVGICPASDGVVLTVSIEGP